MLTKSKKPAYQYLRKLMVLPLVAVAILLFSFTYNKEIREVKRAVENKIETLNNLIQPEGITEKIIEPVKVEIKDTIPVKKKVEVKKNVASTDDIVETSSMDAVTIVGFSNEIEDEKKEPEVFTRVEISASYPGGAPAWKSFLERNLRGEVPVDNGAKPGKYHVFIQFKVDKEGNISNIKPLSNVGYGMEEEAVRVMEKSGKWKPGIFNGKEVVSYRKQPIIFQVLPKKLDKIEEVKIVDQTKGTVEAKKSEREPEIFTKVETDASFSGGSEAWKSFLSKNLHGEIPVDKGAKTGNYTTIIQFIVDKDGTVSDIKPLTKLGYGMEEEAMRIIKISGNWSPAVQNGRVVKAYRKQPITFQVVEIKPKAS